MIIREALEFAIDYLSERLESDRLAEGMKLVLPHVLELANVDRFDAQARAHVQAKIDDTLRAAHLI